MEKTPEVTSLFSFAYVLQQWKEESLSRLTTEEAAVIWDKETEGRNAGLTHHIAKSGHYACKVCRSPLFSWSSKFNSGCGWPAFDKFYQGAVNTITDLSIADMPRIEIVCAKCEGHLGHVFHGEKFTDSDERHCVNSISIVYVNEPCALPEQNVDPEKRGMSSVCGFEPVSLPEPQQRVFHANVVPLVLQNNQHKQLAETVEWVKHNEDELRANLLKHGGILFRGFPLEKAEDFDAFICAFQKWKELPYHESLSFAVRLQVTGRVCTANEGKKGGQVFHHELAQTPFWPSNLFFFCEIPADVGGATAICPSDTVLERVQQKFPEFIQNCESKKVLYSATMASESDSSRGAGRSWKSFFGVKDKEGAEKRMTELEYTWVWLEGDSLKVTSPPLPSIRTTPEGKKVFFNQLIAQYAGNAKEFSSVAGGEKTSISDFLRFEDGTSMDTDALDYAKEVCEETAVEITWQKGDVALIDNFLVMHARRDYDGNRRVLASLVK